MARTFAMRVYAGTYWVLTMSFLYILVAVLLPAVAEDPKLAAVVPVLVVFLGLFVVAAAAATFLPSAPRRRRFWLIALIPVLAFLAMNGPYLPYSFTHPADAAFPGTVPLVVGSIILILAGIAAFREIGAGGATTWGSVRTRWAIGIVAAVTVGASVTGYVGAAQGGGGGAALAAAPTTSATLVVAGTKFLTTSYSVSSSDVLGLFVENRDSSAHSFDIDALDIHVQVPAGATVALAVEPKTSGSLEFYCALPGHREAGMAGTIDVK
jgi:plastocyanin